METRQDYRINLENYVKRTNCLGCCQMKKIDWDNMYCLDGRH
jgi:hypothetical protein